jgi:hypothetical protein
MKEHTAATLIVGSVALASGVGISAKLLKMRRRHPHWLVAALPSDREAFEPLLGTPPLPYSDLGFPVMTV